MIIIILKLELLFFKPYSGWLEGPGVSGTPPPNVFGNNSKSIGLRLLNFFTFLMNTYPSLQAQSGAFRPTSGHRIQTLQKTLNKSKQFAQFCEEILHRFLSCTFCFCTFLLDKLKLQLIFQILQISKYFADHEQSPKAFQTCIKCYRFVSL